MDEKLTVSLDMTPHVARLILEQANFRARCKPSSAPVSALKCTPEDVREASDIVFLALDLISEYNHSRK